jgi:hypothetical protein
MIGTFRAAAVPTGVIFALSNAAPGFAQKHGGVLKLSHFDSPASMSILEESTRAAVQPMMQVFNKRRMHQDTSRAANRVSGRTSFGRLLRPCHGGLVSLVRPWAKPGVGSGVESFPQPGAAPSPNGQAFVTGER